MYVRYRSDYSNQVHQLTITVSKHLYITRDGRLRWQDKPFDINWRNYSKTGKTHIINYLVRDHFSGVFYGTLAHTDAILSAIEFLKCAWSPKPHYPFEGMPASLVVSSTYLSVFPTLTEFLDDQIVEIVPATSGFQAGVCDVRTWEQHFAMSINMAKEKPMTFEDALVECDKACRYACDSPGGQSKLPFYLAHRPACDYPLEQGY